MNRLARLIETLDAEELHLIRRDLDAGTIGRLIDARLTLLAAQARKACPTCGRELALAERRYVLEFGPADLRQRAWFDEIDCLDHFLERYRNPPSGSSPISPITSINHPTTLSGGSSPAPSVDALFARGHSSSRSHLSSHFPATPNTPPASNAPEKRHAENTWLRGKEALR